MSEPTVAVHLKPVFGFGDPLTFEITQLANFSGATPVKAADFGKTLQDAFILLCERMNAVRPGNFQLMQAELAGAELLHLLVGWIFGMRCPTHPFKLGEAVVGDLGFLRAAECAPLSIWREGLPHPPVHARTRFEQDLLVSGHARAAALLIEEAPKTVTVHPSFARCEPVEIVALGWQIGLWFGNRTLLYPMSGAQRFRVADAGGLLGSVMELETSSKN
jgi:hypothetical protein